MERACRVACVEGTGSLSSLCYTTTAVAVVEGGYDTTGRLLFGGVGPRLPCKGGVGPLALLLMTSGSLY